MMELLKFEFPNPLKIEIESHRGRFKLGPSEKAFYISFMREETCIIVARLFETLEESIWSLDAMRTTKFSLVEENRRLLSMIIAVAAYNYRGKYSKKLRSFISKNTTCEELLSLIYLLKTHTARFIAYHTIQEENRRRVGEFLQKEFDRETKAFSEKFNSIFGKDAEAVKDLYHQRFPNLQFYER